MDKYTLPSRKFQRYSAANIMTLKFLKDENYVYILAIIIGLEKDKNRALILSHNIDVKGGELAVEEIKFEPNVTFNDQGNYLSYLRKDKYLSIKKSHFNDKEIKLTFLTDKNFNTLYKEMQKYVDFYHYDKWYSIFYDDDFTPDYSTYYIVRNAMLDWDLKLWEKADKFFKKYPKAVAYGKMPNVNLDVPPQEDCSNYSKILPLRDINGIGPENEKKLRANGITVTKLFAKCKTINEQEDYNYQDAKKCFISYLKENNITENHASIIFEDIDMTINLSKRNFSTEINKKAENILLNLFKNNLKTFPPRDIPGIGLQYEKKLLRYFKEDKKDKIDIVFELFKKYIDINQEQKYNHLATQESFIVYLEKIGINRFYGLRIFYYMTATVTFIKVRLVKNIYELVKTTDPDKHSTDSLKLFYSDPKEFKNDYSMIERYQENRSPINKVFGKEEAEEIEMTCKKYIKDIKDIGLANDKAKIKKIMEAPFLILSYAITLVLTEIRGIAQHNERILRSRGITVYTLFQQYLRIEARTTDRSKIKDEFISFLKDNGITRNHGGMIFEDIEYKVRLLRPDDTPVIPSQIHLRNLINTVADKIQNEDFISVGPKINEQFVLSGITPHTLFKKFLDFEKQALRERRSIESYFTNYLKENGVPKNHSIKIFFDTANRVWFFKKLIAKKIDKLGTETEKNNNMWKRQFNEEIDNDANVETFRDLKIDLEELQMTEIKTDRFNIFNKFKKIYFFKQKDLGTTVTLFREWLSKREVFDDFSKAFIDTIKKLFITGFERLVEQIQIVAN